MSVDDLDLLTNEDLSENVHVDVVKGWVRSLGIEHHSGDIVDFEPVGEVANTHSLISVACGHDNNLVSHFNEALGHIVHVHLDTT